MNKQPFYHRAVVTFTMSCDIDVETAVKKLKLPGLVRGTVEIDDSATSVEGRLQHHCLVVLFTGTRDVPGDEVAAALDKLKIQGLVRETLKVTECDAEPGDPADLM